MKPRKSSVMGRGRSLVSARTVLIALASSVTSVFGSAGTTHAAGQYVEVKYPASTAANQLQVGVTYTLWIPEGVKTLRGVIVHQHGAGTTASKEGATAAYDLHWQALAKKGDCALLGPSYHVLNEKTDLTPGSSELWFDPRRGSEKTFLKALGELGTKSDHPELATVPWALWGHSGGGIWSDVMSTLHPDRVIVVWGRSGTAAMFRTRPEFPPPQVPAAVYAIPIMVNPGVKEKIPKIPDVKGKEQGVWWGNLATFREYRAEGAPIGLAPDPRTGHECGDSRYLAIPFFDACLAIRLPDKGSKDQTLKPVDMSKAWLAPVFGDTARPAAEFKGNPKEAVWLPNEAVAKAWMEYVKTGAVGDTTPPPVPYDVRVSAKADKGTEIVWSADADFESGIGGFVVLRDGKELANVPKTPLGKYGRSLFQSMTYHDTPSQPLAQMRYVDDAAQPGAKHSYSVIAINSVGLRSNPSAEVREPNFEKNSAFYFDGSISRQTLENYLDRSITMGYFLVPGEPEGYKFPYRDDDVRMIHNTGAKFIGRAIYRWGQEAKLGDPAFLEYAKKMVDRVHAADPEVVFQGCLFEQVSANVNQLKIPAWVFADFGLPVEDRTFSRAAIVKRKGRLDRGGGRGGVPIINNLETQLWFYYLAVSYINIGCEALHLGQVRLIGADDKDLKIYSEFLAKVRMYAKRHARRHLVLMDGHVPSGGMVKDGVSLLDFNSFPMRIKAVPGMAVPGKPQEAVLEVGHLDAIFKRSKGCISPSGWKCESLPYLVEFDNFGRGPNPNIADPKSMFCWGWDEISWFAQQPVEYRNQWLHYAHNWIKQTDPNGHLEMPGIRMLTCPNETLRSYFANTKSPTCPVGYSQEETIKKIWNQGQSHPAAFEGEKTTWHGFDRYDFLMDEQTLAIKPTVNKGKVGGKGQRQCIVVVPKAAAAGNPWSWRGCYWDHEPQTEVELLKRGFHIAFVAPDPDGQGKVWDAWYKFLTEKHGFAKKAAFIGMSKGGVNEFNWGVVNPDKVACIYADNPALYDEDFAKLPNLAKHDVPLLHICGSEDFLLQRHTRVVENSYHQLGGRITVIVKEGHAHHPHSLKNPKPIADWIERHMTPSTANRPAFADATFTKGYYYSLDPSFIYLKEEDTYATARGPGFTECYDRYDGPTSGKFHTGGIVIVVPKTVAPGKPWVFTGDAIERDATVEQSLLAKGYHILIVSPLGSGMTLKQWNDAYQLLVDNGYSKKPVLKGTGAKAGEAYAWAEANPDKVACIYARNPLMKSLMAGKVQPIDNLAALAKAGVPVLHDCGATDPWLDTQTRVVEKRFKELDGKITVIVRAGEGHFPLSPKDPKSVVDFIVKNSRSDP